MPLIEQNEQDEFFSIIRDIGLSQADFKLSELNTADPKSDETMPLQGYVTVLRISTCIEKEYPLEDDVAWLMRLKNDLERGLFG
jgi:hypothetical protein